MRFVKGKRRNTNTLIEVIIENHDIVKKIKKLKMYFLLANTLTMIYKCKLYIIPFVITWDGVVTTYHQRYIKSFKGTINIETYFSLRYFIRLSRVSKLTKEEVARTEQRKEKILLKVLVAAPIVASSKEHTLPNPKLF